MPRTRGSQGSEPEHKFLEVDSVGCRSIEQWCTSPSGWFLQHDARSQLGRQGKGVLNLHCLANIMKYWVVVREHSHIWRSNTWNRWLLWTFGKQYLDIRSNLREANCKKQFNQVPFWFKPKLPALKRTSP